MRNRSRCGLKWNKQVAYILCLIMMAVFTTGCEAAYDYMMDDAEYDVSGAADYEEHDNYVEGEDDLSKGNSGDTSAAIDYSFRNDNLLDSHYEKHGEEMGFASPEEYEEAANKVIDDKEVLHKIEAEDGDDVYYLERTNEFVVVSTDGYIRTYFCPNDGIEYFNRQ